MLVPALGGEFSAFQEIVGVIAVSERIEIHYDQYPWTHEPFGKNRKCVANFGVKLVNVEPDGFLLFVDTPIRTIKVVDEMVCAGMTDNPPSALVVIRMLVEPEFPDKTIQIKFSERLSFFVHINVRIWRFALGDDGPSAQPAHSRLLGFVSPDEL